MAHQLALEIGGMIIFAAGMTRFESRALRPNAGAATTILWCLTGFVMIAFAAVQAGLTWSLRLAVLGMYSATGAFLGGTIAAILVKSRAGAVLADLGTGVPTGFKVVSGIGALIGIPAVVIQMISASKPGSMEFLIGQALFFVTSAIRAALMARTKWMLAEGGIIGPNAFVPWRQALAYNWQDANTLGIRTMAGFAGPPRRFTIPVSAEAHEGAAAILASKMAAQ